MQAFLPDALLEQILRDYLIIHWTDLYANHLEFPHPQHRDMSRNKWRASELSTEHKSQIVNLLIKDYPDKVEVLPTCIATLNKLHAGNVIGNTSHSEFIISLTNNDVQWQTWNPTHNMITLPYNQPYVVNNVKLSLSELQENSFYYIDIFVPEND